MKKLLILVIALLTISSIVSCGVPKDDTYFDVVYRGDYMQEFVMRVKSDELVVKPQYEPAAHGYKFLYWATEDGKEYKFDEPLTGDLTLYAVWKRDESGLKRYVVNFYAADGQLLMAQYVTEGSAAISPPAPNSDFFVFDGWDKDFSSVTEDMNIYALQKYDSADPELFTYIQKDDFTYSISGIKKGAQFPQMSGGYVKLALPTHYNKMPITSIEDGSKYNGVFSWLNLLSVYIPSSYEKIGSYAFYGNPALMQVTLCEGLKTIGDGAFMATLGEGNCFLDADGNYMADAYSSALTSIKIPSTVETIGEYAFNHIGGGFKNGIYMMQNVRVDFGVNGNLRLIGAHAFEGAMLTELKLPKTPNKLTIGSYAFAADTYVNFIYTGKENYPISKLTSISLPDTVGSIGDYAFYGAGNNYTYYSGVCTGDASRVQFSSSALKLDRLGEYVFYGAKLSGSLNLGVSSIGKYAFYGQTLSRISLDGVSTMGEYAFGRGGSEVVPLQIDLGTALISVYEGAFINNVGLETLTLPSKIISIGAYAFSGCASLSGKVTFPAALTNVGESAFSFTGVEYVEIEGKIQLGERCFERSALKEIEGSISGVNESTFEGCKNLTTVNLPNNLSKMPNRLFYGCESLKTVVLPDILNEIGSFAFYSCSSLESITIPENVKRIKTGAFEKCSQLSDVVFHGSLTTIEESAFAFCYSLEAIDLPGSVETIGDYAFQGSGLTTFKTPAMLKSMGYRVFFQEEYVLSNGGNNNYPGNIEGIASGDKTEKIALPKLNSFVISKDTGVIEFSENGTFDGSQISAFEVEQGNTKYSSMDGSLFSFDKSRLIMYARDDSANRVVLPECVKEIADRAFMGNNYVLSVVLYPNIEKIGAYAFYKCTRLQSVTFNPGLTTIGDYAFAGTPESMSGLLTISLESATSLVTIGEGAFEYNKELTSIKLPSSLEEIGNNAFYSASSLCVVDLSKATSLKKIGNRAFSGLSYALSPKISSIDFSNCESLGGTGISAFARCGSLASIEFGNLSVIDVESFYDCGALVSLTIGKNIKEINNGAFRNCTALKNIIVPEQNSLMYIRDYAFAGGTSQLATYAKLDLSNAENLNQIGDYAFAFGNVQEVVLPNADFMLGDDVFNSCAKLVRVDLGEGIVYIGENVFRYCTSLSELTIPSSVSIISKDAFRDLNLVKVNIGSAQKGNSISYLGKNVFFNCKKLTEVNIYGNVPMLLGSVDNYSFHYTDTDNVMHINNNVTIYVDKGRLNEYIPGGYETNGWEVYKSLIKERKS